MIKLQSLIIQLVIYLLLLPSIAIAATAIPPTAELICDSDPIKCVELQRRQAYCKSIYGGTINAQEKCMIDHPYKKGEIEVENIYQFLESQKPTKEFFHDIIKDIIKDLKKNDLDCKRLTASEDLTGILAYKNDFKLLLCEMTETIPKREIPHLDNMFKSKTPLSSNVDQSNVVFPLESKAICKNNNQLNQLRDLSQAAISGKTIKSFKSMERSEITSLILNKVAYPQFESTKDNPNMILPVKEATITKRIESLTGKRYNSYSSCINDVRNTKDRIERYNKATYCHFLKPEPKKILTKLARLLSFMKMIQLNIDGCIGKDSLITAEYKEDPTPSTADKIKNKTDPKQSIRISWVYDVLENQKNITKTKYYKLGCVTKFDEKENKSTPKTKSSSNPFYLLISNLNYFNNDAKTLISSLQKLRTHPAFKQINKFTDTYKDFSSLNGASFGINTPVSSTLSPAVVTTYLNKINDILTQLEPMILPLLSEWIAKELIQIKYPTVTSSSKFLQTANYGSPNREIGGKLYCEGTISIQNLEVAKPADDKSFYNLDLIRKYLATLSEPETVPNFAIPAYKDNEYSVLPEITKKPSEDYTYALAGGNMFLLKTLNQPFYKSVKKDSGNGITVPVIETKNKKIAKIEQRSIMLYSDKLDEIKKLKTNRNKFNKKLIKSSKKYTAQSKSLLAGKILSMSALTSLSQSRNLLYKAKCGSKDILVTPMEILKHNATYRLENAWQARIAVSQNSSFILQEMNKILAEKLYIQHLAKRQQEQMIAISNTMAAANQFSADGVVEGRYNKIKMSLDEYFRGKSESDSKLSEKKSQAASKVD